MGAAKLSAKPLFEIHRNLSRCFFFTTFYTGVYRCGRIIGHFTVPKIQFAREFHCRYGRFS